MPAVIDTFLFEHEPPSKQEIAQHFERVHGLDLRGTEIFDSYHLVDPHTVEFSSFGEHVERDYLLHMLMARGGTKIHGLSGEPMEVALPAYVQTPWREQPWWRRGARAAARTATSPPLAVALLPVWFVTEAVFYSVMWAREWATGSTKKGQ